MSLNPAGDEMKRADSAYLVCVVWINCVAARKEGILLRIRNSWSIESIQIHSTAIAQLVSGNLGDDDDHDVEDDDLMIT